MDLGTMKIKELKALIGRAGLEHADCLDKDALIERARMAEARLSAGETADMSFKKDTFPKETNMRVCEACGGSFSVETMKQCAACKGVAYCGRACQKADWSSHKTWCKQQAAHRAAARQETTPATASETARRALDQLFAGKPERAKRMNDKALRADPQNVEAQLTRAMQLCMQRDFDSAISIMEAVRSGGHRSRYDELSYNLGKAYLECGKPGDLDRAIELFRANWAVNPRDSATAAMLGSCYKERDPDAAVEWFQKAIALDARNPPGRADAHHNIGMILMQKGDAAGAAANFKATLAINPNDMFAQFSLMSLEKYL